MSAGLLALVIVVAINSNQIPGIEGFSRRSEVAMIRYSTKSIEIRIVSGDIYEARREQCRAIAENDGQSKPGPLRRLNALMADYQSMTGFAYRLPGCEEI